MNIFIKNKLIDIILAILVMNMNIYLENRLDVIVSIHSALLTLSPPLIKFRLEFHLKVSYANDFYFSFLQPFQKFHFLCMFQNLIEYTIFCPKIAIYNE